ncbi:hypothetical protein D3C74_384920 [compost metagenome]
MTGEPERFGGRIAPRANPDREAPVCIINAELCNFLPFPRVELVEFSGGSQEEQSMNAFSYQAVN